MGINGESRGQRHMSVQTHSATGDDRYIAKLEAELRRLRKNCDERDAALIERDQELAELRSLYQQKVERLAALRTIINLDD
jgi:uncharacterized protein (UPF0276 family)